MRQYVVDAKEVSGLLKQAACQVAARYNCTLQEADKWIQQEARAKRVNLIEVAAAVLAGRSVDYHYDIPV